MKALTLIFVILIALLQYPLWLGKGSWLRVWDLSRQLATQQEKNSALKARNETLDAEVRDLKSGRAAIEERARSELGMIKQDEVFYQVLDHSASAQSVQPPSQTSSTDQASSQTTTPSQPPSTSLPPSKDTVMQRTTSEKAPQ